MEDFLRKFTPRPPEPGLRERIIKSARERQMAHQSVWDRIWSSRFFWSAAFVAILAGLLVPIFPVEVATREVKIEKPSAGAVSMAATLSSIVGGGAKLQAQFAAQL